jgi:hypothetical protein
MDFVLLHCTIRSSLSSSRLPWSPLVSFIFLLLCRMWLTITATPLYTLTNFAAGSSLLQIPCIRGYNFYVIFHTIVFHVVTWCVSLSSNDPIYPHQFTFNMPHRVCCHVGYQCTFNYRATALLSCSCWQWLHSSFDSVRLFTHWLKLRANYLIQPLFRTRHAYKQSHTLLPIFNFSTQLVARSSLHHRHHMHLLCWRRLVETPPAPYFQRQIHALSMAVQDLLLSRDELLPMRT